MRRSPAMVLSFVVLAGSAGRVPSTPALADGPRQPSGPERQTLLSCIEPAALVFLHDFEGCDPVCRWDAWSGAGGVDCTPTPRTVAEIHLDASSCPVLLGSVVITALSADRRQLWVADDAVAAAGQGIFVSRGAAASALPPEFVLGGVAELTGSPLEFDSCPGGITLAEVDADSITLVGTDTPVPLSGVSVADLASASGGEAYEGVLVTISDVEVTSTGSSDQLIVTDASAASIRMDDLAWDYAAASYPVGTCFSTVTGVMGVDLVNDVRVILPRAASDVAVVTCP